MRGVAFGTGCATETAGWLRVSTPVQAAARTPAPARRIQVGRRGMRGSPVGWVDGHNDTERGEGTRRSHRVPPDSGICEGSLREVTPRRVKRFGKPGSEWVGVGGYAR